MSTAAEPSSPYADCDEYIEHRIKAARDRIKWTDLLTALLLAGVLLIGYVLVFTIFDHWVVTGGFRPFTRAAMLTLVLASCAYIVYRYVIRPWTTEVSALYAARMLDNESRGMNGSLLSLVDLNASGAGASDSIRRTIEKRAAVGLAKVNLDEAIDRRWLMQLGFVLFGLVLSTCLYAVFSPKAINLLRPLTVANAAVATQTRILKVQPGTAVIQAGTELEVIADIGGNVPDEVVVLYTTADKTYVDEKFTMQPAEGDGRFRVLLTGASDRGLRQNFTYRITAGDAQTEDFLVTIDQPPTASVLQLTYRYPDYMSLVGVTTENGNIDAWEGSEVILAAEPNVPLSSASIRFSDDPSFTVPAEEFSLEVQGTKLNARFPLNLRQDGTSPRYYRIEVEDEIGRTDPQPTVYGVNIRPDKAPIVKLIDPIRDLQVAANAVVPLLVEAEDPDFLLRSVKLNYEVNGQLRTPEPLFDATRQSLQKSWTGTWEFDLEPLELKQGDVVRYYITARDNKPPLGSQSRSGTLQFEIQAPISEDEVKKQLARDKEFQEQQQRERNAEQQQADDPTKPKDNNQPPAADENASPNDAPKDGDQSGNASKSPNGSAEAGEQAGQSGKQSDGSESGNSENATGNQTQKQGEGGESTDKPTGQTGDNTPSDSSNDAASGKSSSDQGKPSNKPSSPMDDSDAMQRLLESYKEKETRKSTGDSPSDPSPEIKKGDDTGPQNASSNNSNDSNQTDSKTDDATDGVSPDQLMDPAKEKANEKDDSTADASAANENLKGNQSADGSETNNDKPATEKAGKENSTDDASDESQQDPKSNDADGTSEKNPDKTAEPGSGNAAMDDQKQPDSGNETTPQNGENADTNKQQQSEQQGNQPGQQGQDGQQQGNKPGQQGQDGQQQGNKPGQQGQDGQQQGNKPGQQGQDGQQQGNKPGQQGQDGQQQGNKPGQQGQDGQQQGNKPGQQGQDGQQQGNKPGQQGQDGQQQGNKPGQQGQDGGKQSGQEGGKPGDQKTGQQQGDKPGEQGQEGQQQGEKPGEQGQEGGKQGGKEGQQGGQEGGDQAGKEGGKPGGEGKSNSKGEQSKAGNGGRGGKNPAGGGGSNTSGQDQPGGDENKPGSGSGGEEAAKPFKADDPNVQDAAQAADLVLKRLQKDIERGTVDQELLDELGWTEDQLKEFSDRMQQQLNTLKEEGDADSKARQLQRRRVEELLKSLNLQAAPKERVGKTDRDIEQQDTTTQRSAPPSQYKDLLELYQRSLSEGRRR
mgnify:FL=1